jgi:CTP synthase (UTP-ammonia lyase)
MHVAVVGDYNASNETHVAIGAAISHVDPSVDVRWIATDEVDAYALTGADRIFIAPASPYRSFEGAITAIEWARTNDVPMLGTCAGFQHMVIEFARNVAGLTNAGHAEYGHAGDLMLIDELACSLAGETMDVALVAGSVAAAAYTTERVTERYYCRFGLNEEFIPALIEHGLRITGTDAEDEPRVVELPSSRFYVATLFVPQVRSTPERPHPLIEAFLSA